MDHMIAVETLRSRVIAVLEQFGAAPHAAKAVGDVIIDAERDACKSHGLYRLEGCLRVLQSGKMRGDATPTVHAGDGAIVEVEAHHGFSNAAFAAARETLVARTRALGLAALVIRDCVHFSALWHEVEDLAQDGLAALSMCPSYAFVAPVGGHTPLMGTNPLAFGWPRPDGDPYVFDFATSVAARGEIELHRRSGTPIPEGWAVDRDGRPTTDPQAALDGAMLPFGAHKGSAISTMIELLAGAMLGERMSREALEFMGDGGTLVPRHGALIIAMDPALFAARSGRDPLAQGEVLLNAFGAQGARLPSQRRFQARAVSLRDGIRLSGSELAQLEQFERDGPAMFDA